MASRSKRRKRQPQQTGLANGQDAQSGQQQKSQFLAMQAEFRGPLPPPEFLQRYEEIYPGTAERILQQFERETQHRHAVEQKIIDAQLEVQQAEIPALRLGQVFAFIIAVVGLLASAYCVSGAATGGIAAAGASIGGVSLATLAGVFIYGRKSKPPAEETQEKSST